MLNALKEQRNEWSSSRPLSELLPWVTTLTNNIVLCKDGSIFGMFEMRGVDVEGRSALDIDHAAASVERALKTLDDRFQVMWLTNKYRTNRVVDTDEAKNRVDQLYNEWVGGEEFYSMRDLMVVGLCPPEGSSKMFAPILSAISGETPWLKSIKAIITGGNRFNLTIEALATQCEILEAVIRQIENSLPAFAISRISGDDLMGWLNSLASPASTRHPVKFNPDSGYLDTALAENIVSVQADKIQFQGPIRVRHMAAMTIKEWPSTGEITSTSPEMLTPLMGIQAEYTLVRVLKPLAPEQSRKHVSAIRRHHIMRATPLLNHLRKAMSDEKIEEHKDPACMADADEAGAALNEINGGITGWLSTTLLLYADDPRALDTAVEVSSKSLSHAGVIAFRESLHTLSAWAGSLPGNWNESIRYVWATGANAADISPIVTLSEGDHVNSHLTEQSHRKQSAIAAFQTNYKTAYWFNFHYGDVGHSMVIGPSGAGKSVFVNFLLTRWQKYAPCQTYVFDKDKSCYITTLANNGKYLDPAAGGMAMNPMAELETDADWEWFVSWLEIPLTHREKDLTSADDKSIRDAVEAVRKLEPSTRRLKTLAMILPERLAERLNAWVEGGQYERWFDHAEDSFSLDSFVTIAMDDLFRQPSVARAFLEYAFFRINRRMTGDPTIIYLEEAWFALSDPMFASRIDNWLRTLRKKNGTIVMATQNLDELTRSEAFAAIADNIPTRIFLANPNVDSHSLLYQERFGLRPSQLDIIRNATAKQDYLITNPDHSRLIKAQFPARIIAYLRSDQRAIKTFKKWEESGEHNYIRRYEDEISE